MIYSLLFTYIIIYSSILQKVKTRYKDFIIFFIPIATLLVLILGLQYNVGADYYSYLGLADGTKNIAYIERKSEILFLILVEIVKYFNNPQLIFVFTALIQTIFLMLIAYEIKKLNFRIDVFFFLYFSLALVFFNQFNGIRQYTAVYIVVYALLQLMNKKNKTFIALTVMAGLFHTSAYFFLILLPLHKIVRKKISTKVAVLVLLVLLVISFFNLDSIYYKILNYLPQYSNYIGSSYMKRLPIEGIITKIPKLAIVLFSIINVNKQQIEENKIFLINLSYIACGIMVLSFSSSIIWRFYQYVDMFLIFPVMMLMADRSKKTYSILISIALIIMLIIKIIIMPIGEYQYNSILF